jgi:hypothetical protein
MVPSDPPSPSSARAKPVDVSDLDALTGGALSAPTSGERAARIRNWLASDPSTEQLSEVFKELSHRDKGAARPVRERLDELRRLRSQDLLVAEWAERARGLLDLTRLNLADALAWQRDAAKAGAPLSREPLASLRQQLNERVKSIEDTQHRLQVQREAAVLLVQRIELLSTKSWRDAQAQQPGLKDDVAQWQDQTDLMIADSAWPSVDPRFALQIDAARQQLQMVWQAFEAALVQALTAAADPAVALPAVPVWADELRVAREQASQAQADKPARPKADPVVLARQRAQAAAAVQQALEVLAREVGEGHGKAAPKAAADLRQILKEHGRHIDAALEAQVHAALTSAGELEGWQRWRADQIREELLTQAQALVVQPLGGRKQQEALRQLREQWKTSDQGGLPNHALWRKFDDACNQAHKVVEEWLKQVREQQEASKAQRQALMDELRAWTEAHQGQEDWKLHLRSLQSFEQRWRESGHLSEKLFAQWQAQWKQLIDAAQAPLQAARQHSLGLRRALIDEAQQLAAQQPLRIDAVRALQQRWQQESQRVPLDRRQEQKLWDAFRKPIDEAFARKSTEREKAAQALGEFDRRVMIASAALEKANTSGDAQQIQAAVRDLEAALRAPTDQPPSPVKADDSGAQAAASVAAVAPALAADAAAESLAPSDTETPAQPASPAAPTPSPKPVVAVRGDDRPGARKPEPTHGARSDRTDRGPRRDGQRDRGAMRAPREGYPPGPLHGGQRGLDRSRLDDRGPRLGGAAFRAQREAMEHAQQALRKLAAQAHGEVLTQIMNAWQTRDAAQVPSAQALGKALSASARQRWTQALQLAPTVEAESAATALLRLEIAADLPTPADQLSSRRMLQLQLLTQKHATAPAQTWAEDVATLFSSVHQTAQARRLQSVLKVLLRQ